VLRVECAAEAAVAVLVQAFAAAERTARAETQLHDIL
jgi:hypothetical protein